MQQLASKHVLVIGFNPLSMQFGKQRRENTLLVCPGSHWFPHSHGMEGAGVSEGVLGFRSQAVLYDVFHLCSKNYSAYRCRFCQPKVMSKSLRKISKGTLEEDTIHTPFFLTKHAVSVFSLMKDIGQV